MHLYHPTILSSTDHARLQSLMATLIGSRTRLAALLRRKLGSAVVVLPGDLAPDLATSGRRVQFSIDGDRLDERMLVWRPSARLSVPTLSILETRGLALLGLSIGESISYETDTGQTETLQVEFVFAGDEPSSPVIRTQRRLAAEMAS